MSNPNLDIAQQAINHILKFGADKADILISEGVSLRTSSRLGKQENIERAEGHDMGLRAIIGNKQAFVSGTNICESNVQSFAESVVAMAKITPSDPYCDLADASLLCKNIPNLDLNDPDEPDIETLQNKALETEEVARHTKGITNSEGAEATWGRTITTLMTSHGFSGSYPTSYWSLSCCVLGGVGDKMERDYASHITHHREDLQHPNTIGLKAAQRTLQRLNPRKIKTQKAPVIFDPRVSNSLLQHFSSAISGGAIARNISFLKQAMGQTIFPKSINIMDDPHRKRGLNSTAFDGEGVDTQKIALVENGILKNWLLDSTTSRQLNLQTNGRATRGISSPPTPSATNLYMQAGACTPEMLRKQMKNGLYVTELIGMGVNGITGDYSRGAVGFWIENGEIAYPISEITIASNLKDMFQHLTVADDLQFTYGINAPTILIEEMTLAGL